MNRFTLLLFLVPILSFAQETSDNKNALYLRAGIYEVSMGYQRKFQRIGIGFEVDFRPAFKPESYSNWYEFASFPFSMQTFRTKVMLPIYFRNDNFLSPFVYYRNGNADKIIYDPGKFGGSNTSDYREYSEQNNEVGIGVMMHKTFRRHPAIQFYYGVSIGYKNAQQHYTVTGSYSTQIPTDYNEVHNWIIPGFYLGFKFDVLRF